MALFRQGLPRRAVVGAFVGFVYSLTLLVRPEGNFLAAFGWFLLSIALLFAKPISYYGFLTWGILWLAWRAVLTFRGQAGPWWLAVVDVGLPLLCVALVSASGYLEFLRADEQD